MNEKTVIITGANSGIGKEAAVKFASEGYTVIMACRNLKKSERAYKEVMNRSNNHRVDLMELDVSSFHSIHNFCSAFKQKYDKLDILIHNAAYFNHGEKYQLSSDHIELTFATNTFGPFLMTWLLQDHLKKSGDPRVLNACSSIIKHFFDPKRKIDFDLITGDLEDVPSYSVYKMYAQSKMALLILTFKMAEEFRNDGIKVNALQINGARMSKETLKKFKPGWRMIARIQNLYFPSPEVIANHYFEICSSEKFKKTTGRLFNNKLDEVQSAHENPNLQSFFKQLFGSDFYPRYADDTANREKMWDLSIGLTHKANNML